MRKFKRLAIVLASVTMLGLTAGTAFAGTHHTPVTNPVRQGTVSPASPSISFIHPFLSDSEEPDPYNCVNDPSNIPSEHHHLNLAACNANNIAQGFFATPSSFGSGYYSVVLGNQSGGNYCVDAINSANGSPLEPVGCNGTQEQAWRVACVHFTPDGDPRVTYPELVNGFGVAMNDYGDFDSPGTPVVAWAAESPAPSSLLFDGPNGLSPFCLDGNA